MLRKRWVAAAALAAAAVAAPTASAETVYGLTDSNDLVVFDTASPGTTSNVIDVTPNNVNLEGIDFRPATLQLYGLADTGQLFRIDIQTGATTAIGTPVALTGGDFDIDFNPTIDRLRVVSDTEESLVVNPNTGGPATVGAAINPAGNVTGAAYTRNAPSSAATDGADAGLQPDAPTTVLLDVDTGGTDRLASQNVGTGALTTVGNLGVDLVGDVGFDISTTSTTGTGAVGTDTGYIVGRTSDTNDRLYTVNLTNGLASAGVQVGSASKVKDLAVAPAIPQLAVLYTPAAGAQQIVTYRADRPGSAGTPVNVTGLQGGETLVGIDRRPANNMVYGVGSTGRVYTLNLANGAATVVPGGPFAPLPSGDAGVDFNPAPGAAIRIVTETEQNFAVDSTTSAVTAGTALDYPTGDTNAAADPNVTGASYINPVTPAPAPAAAQLLYDVDTGLDQMAFQGIEMTDGTDLATPAFGNGVLTTQGLLGVPIDDGTGFDIAARFNQQFGAFDPTGADPQRLYSVNAFGAAGMPAAGGAVVIGDLAGVTAPALTTQVGGMTVVQDNILPAAPTPTATATPTATPTYAIPTATATPPPNYNVKRKPNITAKARPKKDKKKPFVFRVQGTLRLPAGVSRSAGCKGTVKIVARKGNKVIGRRRAGIKSSCKYKSRVKLRKAGKRGTAKFTVTYLGSNVLLKDTAKTSAKYGKKKKRNRNK